jgi:hypothetical protein
LPHIRFARHGDPSSNGVYLGTYVANHVSLGALYFIIKKISFGSQTF